MLVSEIRCCKECTLGFLILKSDALAPILKDTVKTWYFLPGKYLTRDEKILCRWSPLSSFVPESGGYVLRQALDADLGW